MADVQTKTTEKPKEADPSAALFADVSETIGKSFPPAPKGGSDEDSDKAGPSHIEIPSGTDIYTSRFRGGAIRQTATGFMSVDSTGRGLSTNFDSHGSQFQLANPTGFSFQATSAASGNFDFAASVANLGGVAAKFGERSASFGIAGKSGAAMVGFTENSGTLGARGPSGEFQMTGSRTGFSFMGDSERLGALRVAYNTRQDILGFGTKEGGSFSFERDKDQYKAAVVVPKVAEFGVPGLNGKLAFGTDFGTRWLDHTRPKQESSYFDLTGSFKSSPDKPSQGKPGEGSRWKAKFSAGFAETESGAAESRSHTARPMAASYEFAPRASASVTSPHGTKFGVTVKPAEVQKHGNCEPVIETSFKQPLGDHAQLNANVAFNTRNGDTTFGVTAGSTHESDKKPEASAPLGHRSKVSSFWQMSLRSKSTNPDQIEGTAQIGIEF